MPEFIFSPNPESLPSVQDISARRWLRQHPDGEPDANLEYDARFLELFELAQGVPETQFSEAKPPCWNEVLNQAENLLNESHDIRLLCLWLEASFNQNGLKALPDCLVVLSHWVKNQWEYIYPPIDQEDQDLFERVNALAPLTVQGSLFHAFRNASLLHDAHFGGVTIRHFEQASDWSSVSEIDSSASKPQLIALLSSGQFDLDGLESIVQLSLQGFSLLEDCLSDRLERVAVPDFSLFTSRLNLINGYVVSVRQANIPNPEPSSEGPSTGSQTLPSLESGAVASKPVIHSRQQAIELIDCICLYLEAAEPSNPARFLLQRAKQSMDKDFIHLIRDMAPDALRDVARIFGISPDAYE
ncbi:MAG: type VI secretion system ImpA family N-terminal domain-containing protein [Limnobacter sp.]|nr:type VI secretion system ImpA family N-terminal domain-containing protein [Limnobacter sp.]